MESSFFKNIRKLLKIIRLKEEGIQDCGNNIVKGVCTRGNAKTPNCKEDGKVDSRHGPKTEGCPVELTAWGELSVDEHKVMVGTE